MSKKRANEPVAISVSDHAAAKDMTITALGSGQEVGRSAVVVKFRGKTILFDCGIHPAKTGQNSLPHFDMIDPEEVDLVLVTHFHLDHCGALPYFTEKTNFKGRVFMTHPTKAIYKLIMNDFVKISKENVDDRLFDEKELAKSLERVELCDYHQEVEHNGIRFWCYNAGHVLGAAMFMIEIAGVRVLYTGDFSRTPDRHLMGAETTMAPDVLIVESTYGTSNHEPRPEREARFIQYVTNIVKRGGRCLLPVFALGRAQELLLILDEYWQANPSLHHVPIYYASALANKCMAVYQTYINMMNDKIRKKFSSDFNPFEFKHIENLRSIDEFEDNGPCVIMASPGMLQNGMSRELFERWCQDKRNGVVLPGYCVEGTLAKTITNGPEEILLSTGQTVPLRMSVDYISFSAHSDFAQTSEFVDSIRPPHIMLVHGDQHNMKKLKTSLETRYRDVYGLQIHMPKNCEELKLEFKSEKIAKTIGKLAVDAVASSSSSSSSIVKGVMVRKGFQHSLMSEADLSTFTQIQTTHIRERLYVSARNIDLDRLMQLAGGEESDRGQALMASLSQAAKLKSEDGSGLDVTQVAMNSLSELLRAALSKQFEKVELVQVAESALLSSDVFVDGSASAAASSSSAAESKTVPCLRLMGGELFILFDANKKALALDWEGSPAGSMLVDSLLLLMLAQEGHKHEPHAEFDAEQDDLLDVTKHMLQEYYPDISVDSEACTVSIRHDGAEAVLNPYTLEVTCALNAAFGERIRSLFSRLFYSLFPIGELSCGCA